MRLAIISSRFPQGNSEPYLGVELDALRPHVEHLVVAPVHSNPWAPATLALACKTVLRAPLQSLSALKAILHGSGTMLVKLKNLVVYGRALALAEEFHAERIGHVHSYWLSTPATAAFVIAKVNGIAWSSTAHRWDIFEQNMIPEKARSAAFVRAISERGRGELVRRAPDAAEKFVVVRLGTALTNTSRAPGGVEASRFRLLCAAAFRPVKGHGDLLTAFAAAHEVDPSLSLVLCGEGPLEAETRRRAAALPCRDAVTFRGYVPHAQLLRELAAGEYDAVILASWDDGVRLMEGVPSILVEAASLGITCIATRSGGITELLDDESAFLVPPWRPHVLARAILEATDADERRHRATEAAQRARCLHDPARSALQLVALLGATA